MKKILGIYIFFNKAGVVDEYLFYILKKICEIFTKTIFVINGNIDSMSYEKVKSYTKNIFVRENIGYDAGAYKDVLTNFISVDELNKYDELVLMNNSFYGPLFELQEVWKRMNLVEADFWGITQHPNGDMGENKTFPKHIQAYFLVIRKRMFMSKDFINFWKDMEYPKVFERAILDFEIAFTEIFEKKGYVGKTLMDICPLGFEVMENENPYLYHSFELIKNIRLPFLKKKCLYIENPGYINAIEALKYIEDNLEYDINIIWDNIYKECKMGIYGSALNYDRLEVFYNTHEIVYIYGMGQYGKSIYKFFQYKNWSVKSFVVSGECINRESNVISYKELNLSENDGIILALGKKNATEVYANIKTTLKQEQILLLEY